MFGIVMSFRFMIKIVPLNQWIHIVQVFWLDRGDSRFQQFKVQFRAISDTPSDMYCWDDESICVI